VSVKLGVTCSNIDIIVFKQSVDVKSPAICRVEFITQCDKQYQASISFKQYIKKNQFLSHREHSPPLLQKPTSQCGLRNLGLLLV